VDNKVRFLPKNATSRYFYCCYFLLTRFGL
jgi:hypothetical protein